MTEARQIVLTGLFAALAVILSFINIPVGPAKVYPFQHMVNAVAGVLIGPWYGALAALIAGLIRNAIGTGTPLAFPGGIPGAIVVGLAYKLLRKDWTSLTEPLGTGVIGVGLVVLLMSPLMKKEYAFLVIFPSFMASSVVGAVIGYFLLKTLRKAKILEQRQIPGK